ncbi:hypothetical protein B0T16DRAFT_412274 [Cercophora newfieldiana]|uniref:Uncharacterized protein n=1 Tax=Cercophora newfieldiana TaxID=92897 RepID=A0AA39Y4L6_9PEZI|nr:hypothetical protein B0T16DRAFT_412274 [Cercophora newfieldiana]
MVANPVSFGGVAGDPGPSQVENLSRRPPARNNRKWGGPSGCRRRELEPPRASGRCPCELACLHDAAELHAPNLPTLCADDGACRERE